MKWILAFAFSLSLTAHVQAAGPSCEGLFESKQELFNSYEPWGLQIFNREINFVKNAFASLEGKTATEKIDAMLEIDIRRIFFRLQSLSRVYEEMDGKVFEKSRAFFKSIEDGLGQVDLARSLRLRSEKINEPVLVNYFAKQEAQAQQNLIQLLKETDLLQNSEKVLSKVQEKIVGSKEWPSAKKDRKYQVNLIADFAKDLNKAVKDNKFDENDIEKGLHELRRRIRWISIQIMSLNGAIVMKPETQLSEPVAAWFKEALKANPDMLENKFSKTDPVEVANPIIVPQKMFGLLSNLINLIGAKKDGAELQIYAREALEKLGTSESRIEAVEKKIEAVFAVEHVDHRSLARGISEQLAETGLLKEFARELRKNIED